MYGAIRTRAPSSTRLAGASTAVIITVTLAAVLGSGFGSYLVKAALEPIVYVPLPDETDVQPTPTNTNPLAMSDDPLTLTTPLTLIDKYIVEPDTPTGSTDNPPRTDPVPPGNGEAVLPPARSVRVTPKRIPGPSPVYPASEVRKSNQGVTRIDLCVDARGAVSSAALAQSSGHPKLDDAAMKWVRGVRFAPGTVDGVAQPMCGYPLSYEWTLENAR